MDAASKKALQKVGAVIPQQASVLLPEHTAGRVFKAIKFRMSPKRLADEV